MKNICFSLLALATTLGSFANPSSQSSCPEGCPVKATVLSKAKTDAIPVFTASSSLITTATAESFAAKMARIEDSFEDQKGYLNFQQTMSTLLNQLETEKYLDAVDDLKAASAYTKLMTNTFLEIETAKLADASENEMAYEQYNRLMSNTLTIASGL